MNALPTEKDVGKTTVSLEVIHKIARLTALSVPGVSRMACFRGSVEKLLSKEEFRGVKVHIKDEMVFVDVFVVLMSDRNVREISREIQARVSRTISEMIGMNVGGVNIHILDIDFVA